MALSHDEHSASDKVDAEACKSNEVDEATHQTLLSMTRPRELDLRDLVSQGELEIVEYSGFVPDSIAFVDSGIVDTEALAQLEVELDLRALVSQGELEIIEPKSHVPEVNLDDRVPRADLSVNTIGALTSALSIVAIVLAAIALLILGPDAEVRALAAWILGIALRELIRYFSSRS